VYNMLIQRMNTNPSPNPKLSFYRLLYQFLTAPEFIAIVAAELVRQHGLQNAGITCPEFNLEDLEGVHEERHEYETPTYNDFTLSLIDAFFRDMSPQLRTEEVQILAYKYGQLEPYQNMVMMRVDRVKLLGNLGAAKMTITVLDWKAFFQRMNFQLQDDIWDGPEPKHVPAQREEVLWSCTPDISRQLGIRQHSDDTVVGQD
jgi:hypothetical protein